MLLEYEKQDIGLTFFVKVGHSDPVLFGVI